MNLRILFLFLILAGLNIAFGQNESPSDSSRILEEVVVKAYSHRKPLEIIPAALTVLRQSDMERFSNSSLVPVINMAPGVRMEERSPGSYRLSVRGSSVRSPFGVRNVKVYWNGMPFTDPGGNTYLNLLDFSSADQVEIIRGPGASRYGAGTGGVLLMESLPAQERSRSDVTAGSYGMLRISEKLTAGNESKYIQVKFSHQKYGGYREQSAMERNFLQLDARTPLAASTALSFFGFVSGLQYETPGGLTLEQFNADPLQARPAAGPNAGAVEQKASVRNTTVFGGLSLEQDWGKNWNTQVWLGGNFTGFRNPAIRNYEERNESSLFFRAVTDYGYKKGKFSFGAEGQSGIGKISIFQNLTGKKGDLTGKSDTPVRTGLIFVQNDLELPAGFFLTSGLSLNRYQTRFNQAVPEVIEETAISKWILIPRAGLSKSITERLTGYAQIGKGFSPPTTAEFFPSTAVFNPDLKPESGYSSEAGLKGKFPSMNFTVNVFRMRLNNTIVVRRDEAGADYFVNAGSTLQRGMESSLKFQPLQRTDAFRHLAVWMSAAFNDFKFENYRQGSSDLSGNRLTGTPELSGAGGLDFSPSKGFNFQFTAMYCGALPLDDRNTVFAGEFWTFGLRAGYRMIKGRYPLEIMAGADNITDRKYSLGHDLNAAGGRFYNAAPGRSFYAGIILRRDR